MRRREFLGVLGGAVAWPEVAGAKPVLVIGLLSSGAQDAYANFMAAFRRGLSEAGFAEGRNIAIESRWADGQFERLPALAADLVNQQVAVMVATGLSSALAAKAASSTIPLVFLGADDPVRFGLVASLSHPGGSATGINVLTSELTSKRLALLRELGPQARTVAVLMNPSSPEASLQLRDLQSAASAIGQPVAIINASNEREFVAAFTAAKQQAGVLIVSNDPFFYSRRDQLVALAAQHHMPTIYDRREYAASGGLISYGTHYLDAYRLLGGYTARILSGTKPADLPVEQVSRFELVINLKTAKTLGLAIPQTLLVTADEVIE
jgi:putative ABC transport system substrate-binding protein